MANTIDISSLQTFTDTDLLTIYRYAMATGGFRKMYNVNGRDIEVPDAQTVMNAIAWLEQRIEDDSNSAAGGMVSLAQFNPAAPPENT